MLLKMFQLLVERLQMFQVPRADGMRVFERNTLSDSLSPIMLEGDIPSYLVMHMLRIPIAASQVVDRHKM